MDRQYALYPPHSSAPPPCAPYAACLPLSPKPSSLPAACTFPVHPVEWSGHVMERGAVGEKNDDEVDEGFYAEVLAKTSDGLDASRQAVMNFEDSEAFTGLGLAVGDASAATAPLPPNSPAAATVPPLEKKKFDREVKCSRICILFFAHAARVSSYLLGSCMCSRRPGQADGVFGGEDARNSTLTSSPCCSLACMCSSWSGVYQNHRQPCRISLWQLMPRAWL